MQSLSKASLAESATEALRAEIVSGGWPLGTKLPNEATLSATLSVSRGTVREAVRVLVAQGLLETRQGSGTYVRSSTDASKTLAVARRTSLRDQFEARCGLDVEAARLAALRHTPPVIAELRRLLRERGHYEGGDRGEFIRRDLAFHKAVIAASGNRALMEIYDFFSATIAETIEATISAEVPEPDMQAHADIIDAIETGDPEAASAAVRRFMAPVLSSLDTLQTQ
jgi:DNA-binding FadR family transcriptional regulator